MSVSLPSRTPGEPVERATELVDAAALGTQLRAPMQTGVDVGADRARARAHHDEGVMDDLIEDVVADIGDLLKPAGQLPGLAPDLLHLLVVPRLGPVALDGKVAVAQVLRRKFGEHHRRRGIDVAGKHVLHRGPGASGQNVDDRHGFLRC